MYKQVLKEPKVARKIDKIVFLVFIIHSDKSVLQGHKGGGNFFPLF